MNNDKSRFLDHLNATLIQNDNDVDQLALTHIRLAPSGSSSRLIMALINNLIFEPDGDLNLATRYRDAASRRGIAARTRGDAMCTVKEPAVALDKA
jgi:hypothetical protein